MDLAIGVPVDTNLCIICQDPNATIQLTSATTGRKAIKRTAEIRNDIVYKRLCSIDRKSDSASGSENVDVDSNSDHVIKYHNTNPCYKSYCHIKTLKAIEKKKINDNKTEDVPMKVDMEPPKTSKPTMSSRRQVKSREPPSTPQAAKKKKCTICGKVSYKKSNDKFRIDEKYAAINLATAARTQQDEVFIRIVNLLRETDADTVSAIRSADIYVHPECSKKYLRIAANQEEGANPKQKLNIKKNLFIRALPHLKEMINKKVVYSIRELRDFTLSMKSEEEKLESEFRIRDMKQMMSDEFSDSITFIPNPRINESDIVFSSDITKAELAVKINNLDVMKKSGEQLRQSLLDVDFGLDDKFCDADDLKDAWENTIMPSELSTFFSSLFNIPKHKLFKSSEFALKELFDEEMKRAKMMIMMIPKVAVIEKPHNCVAYFKSLYTCLTIENTRHLYTTW